AEREGGGQIGGEVAAVREQPVARRVAAEEGLRVALRDPLRLPAEVAEEERRAEALPVAEHARHRGVAPARPGLDRDGDVLAAGIPAEAPAVGEVRLARAPAQLLQRDRRRRLDVEGEGEELAHRATGRTRRRIGEARARGRRRACGLRRSAGAPMLAAVAEPGAERVRAVLLGIQLPDAADADFASSLDELARLAQ